MLAEKTEARVMARCAEVEKLVGMLSREFRLLVDNSEQRMRAAIAGEAAVIEKLASLLEPRREFAPGEWLGAMAAKKREAKARKLRAKR